jgi:SOS-response transcriptional repressor LexA
MRKRIEILDEWEPWQKKIAKAINDSKMSMKEVSLAAGMSETYIRDVLKRGNAPSFKRLNAIHAVLGVSDEEDTLPIPVHQIRVEGVSQAGMFRDISLIEDNEYDRQTIPVPVNPKYAHVHQYALLVAGDSMNNKFQDGSYVTCAEWAGLGKELKHGMILHVERVKAGSMIETTIKTYIERDGKRWLEPDSTNSKHLPIEINGGLDTEIHIKGAVIGSYVEFEL